MRRRHLAYVSIGLALAVLIGAPLLAGFTSYDRYQKATQHDLSPWEPTVTCGPEKLDYAAWLATKYEESGWLERRFLDFLAFYNNCTVRNRHHH